MDQMGNRFLVTMNKAFTVIPISWVTAGILHIIRALSTLYYI